MLPVVIVGAGPAGLATAACLERSGVRFALLDRAGVAGGSFLRMHQKMKLLSPRRYVLLPHFACRGRDDYPGISEYASYLADYARKFKLTPEPREVAEIRWPTPAKVRTGPACFLSARPAPVASTASSCAG